MTGAQVGTPRQPRDYDSDALRLGALCLDREQRRVQVDSQPVELTVQEFDLLAAFLQRPNQILSHKTLCELMWGSFGAAEQKRLSVVVSHVREKLGPAGPCVIASVRCRGYGLMHPTWTRGR